VSGVPATKALANPLEDVGRGGISAWTDEALDLHGYQYHGPDPDMALSKYARQGGVGVGRLAAEVARRVEALKPRVK